MGLSDNRIRELAQQLAAHIEPSAERSRPKLRLIQPARPTRFDAITRDCCIRRVRDLQRLYGLGWLVRQETFDRAGIETLEDDELSSLLKTMEQAAECCREGVPLEDVGFIRIPPTEWSST